MKIEYENKNTISWCIDRSDNTRICFNAISMANRLESIKISGEDFKIEFDYDEAFKFLEILKSLISIDSEISTKASQELVMPDEATSSQVEPNLLESIIESKSPFIGLEEREFTDFEIEKPPLEPEIDQVVIEHPEPKDIPIESHLHVEEDETSLDEAEIIYNETESLERPLEEQSIDLPEPSEIIDVIRTSQESYDESMDKVFSSDELDSEEHSFTMEEVMSKATPPSILKFSELSRTEVETASFFQETEEKSPLELLLEEEKIDSIGIPDPFEEIESISPRPAYSPKDIQTESFISRFEKEEAAIESEESGEELTKTQIIEKPEIQLEETIIPSLKYDESLTEEERKRKIEKERAERRRRLWELTRGF